ncbi:uncharacterized protein KGF55_000943 [Candida pseudojiufengensis]|uniref:uncharacterized protein n=1 Tax=Candida pseudojiufengensis TaxID=497109 RepID=UPI002224A8DB|nr:uncharacterized protein KGF55_000943 [Candida pseudojiufengensis]KAI5965581.1 hypothetical protein KGF55_000943 [Candida pseudojiufengensis]
MPVMNSSPETNHITYDDPRDMSVTPPSILDSIRDKQERRNRIRLNPLSSSPLQSPTHQIYQQRSNNHQFLPCHHNLPSSPTRPINLRNKHNKIRQVRDQHRQEKIRQNRDKTTDSQLDKDSKAEHESQVDDYLNNRNIDQLIEDEEEYLLSQIASEEAELRALEEEMEILTMLESLEL